MATQQSTVFPMGDRTAPVWMPRPRAVVLAQEVAAVSEDGDRVLVRTTTAGGESVLNRKASAVERATLLPAARAAGWLAVS